MVFVSGFGTGDGEKSPMETDADNPISSTVDATTIKTEPGETEEVEMVDASREESVPEATPKPITQFGRPGDFSVTRDADGKFHFTWTKPNDVEDESVVEGYTITVSNYLKCDVPQGTQYRYDNTNGNIYAASIQLDKETSYNFEIRAYAGDYVSRAKRTETILPKHAFLNQSTKIRGSAMPTYLIPTRDTSTHHEIFRKEVGKPSASGVVTDEKVILVVGATGSGKTTWINAILNYTLGVKYSDNFRYKMVVDKNATNQACSQTQNVTIYTIHHQEGFMVDYTLTIIDTPGFGDTRGIFRDKEIEKLFKSTFDMSIGGVDHLDAVGFMACSSSARLSQTQKYIFTSILSLFGVDIKENIFMLLTFADGHIPQVLHAIKEANLPYDDYFKFNNSAIFISTDQEGENDDETHGDFNKMFWDLGMKSFKKFLHKVYMTKTKSLTLTRGVLDERERIEITVVNLHKQVKKGLSYMEQLRDEVRILETAEKDIKGNKDYTYKVKRFEMNKQPLTGNQNTTTCLECNFTCHANCAFENDSDKKRCIAMDREGDCKQCKGNCRWDMHRNLPYIYEEKEIFVTCTKDEIKARYEQACGQKLTKEQTIAKIHDELNAVEAQIKAALSEISCSLQRLKEIALHDDPKTQVEYIDLLIETERTEAKPGWQGRIKGLNDLRQQAQDICDIDKGKFDPFKNYRESAQEAREQGCDMKKTSTWLAVFDKLKWATKSLGKGGKSSGRKTKKQKRY